ncbi:MAG: exodeoxyribonuclease III, partial [Verrucomicrobiales bacterium]|nr:exodeoxyribonuclease III [Verrucomicrobiales bacterium]
MLNIISWNVNGFRAALNKGFAEWFNDVDADVVCLQEAKALPEQVDLDWLPSNYQHFWNPAEKKGYSGVVALTKRPPLNVIKGMGIDEHDSEGRVITLEFASHFLVNVYTPNSQNALRRLPYRETWDQAFRAFLENLGKTKPVIFCGDLNVAHTELDIKNAKSNWNKNPGYTEQE